MNDEERAMIRQFVSGHANDVPIDDDEDLFANGHVNSLFAVQLVMWVERTFDVAVETADLDFANFQAVSSIAAFVDDKRAECDGAGAVGEGAHGLHADR
jgi:methoxymalonate biosynthesis acyl carrier protein